MKRRKPLLACVTALAAGATLWALLPSPAGAQRARMTFFSPYRLAEDHQVDANHSGSEDAGDYFTGSFVLNKRGKRAGHFEFQCTRISETPKREQCVGTARIKGRGSITAQGAQPPEEERIRAAITGGTGEFVGDGGTVTLDFKRTGVRITFNVR